MIISTFKEQPFKSLQQHDVSWEPFVQFYDTQDVSLMIFVEFVLPPQHETLLRSWNKNERRLRLSNITKEPQNGSRDEFKKSQTTLDIKTVDKDIDSIRSLLCAFIWCIKELYFTCLLSAIFRRRTIRNNIRFNCNNIHIENLNKTYDKKTTITEA